MSEDLRAKLRDSLSTEYYRLVGIVSDFDKNLLTVKGWGVTLSLAALAWGFQYQRPGLFLVSCVSGVAFWAIEAVMKRHQMRYYVRMREIEVVSSELLSVELREGWTASSPRIDWSWTKATRVFKGENENKAEPLSGYGRMPSYAFNWVLPHVALPHVITALLGGLLFVLYAENYLSFPPAK